METSPKISIIMPTYNRAQLIGETVDSIRNQTFTDWELLIMDDGSDDNTEAIIQQYHDDRIFFFKCGRSGQVSKLKNKAIERSRAGLIAFIDSDDLWAPVKLEKQFAAMKQYPDMGFCLTGGFTFVKQDEPVQYLYKQREGVRLGDFLLPMFSSEISGFTQALLFRKECVHISGFFDETKLFSDPDFILSLACHHQGVLLYEPLFFRRLLEKSDSDEHWEERYNEWSVVIEEQLVKKRISAYVAKAALFKLYINFGEKCLRRNRSRKAIAQFFKAWINKPFSIIPAKKMAKAVLLTFR